MKAASKINFAVAALIISIIFAGFASADQIDKNRTGEFELIIKDDSNVAIPSARVEYELKDRAFNFGFFTDINNPAVTQKMIEMGADFTTVHLNWRLTEPENGKYDWNNTEAFYDAKAYKEAGLKVMATAVLWFQKGFFPEYLRGRSFNEVKSMAEKHLRAVVNRYKNHIDIWNVLNEPSAPWANELNWDEDQFIEMIKMASKVVRDLDPSAKVMVNFADPLSFYRDTPLSFVKKMQRKNVDYDILGLQVYYTKFNMNFNGKPFGAKDLDDMITTYAQFNKEIHISEMSFSSGPNEHTNQWTEKMQADWAKELFDTFYARKEVTAITWWNATDRLPFRPLGGLLTVDGKEKQSYKLIQNLITKKWNTSGSGKTDRNGKFSFTGIAGTYNVCITDPASGLVNKIEVDVVERKDKRMKSVFKEKRVLKKLKRENRQLERDINDRRNWLKGLANYWESRGDQQKASIARNALKRTDSFATPSGASSIVLPSQHEDTLSFLEDTLDKVAVNRTIVLEGKDMKTKKGLWVFTDWNMDFYSFGRVGTKVNLQGRSAKVTVTAAGKYDKGWPIFSLGIGTPDASDEVTLNEGGWTDYSFDLNYRPGSQYVDLAYVNDYHSSNGGRDLFVKKIEIVEKSWVAPK